MRRIPPDARGARREHTDPRGSRYEAGHYSDPYADPYADQYGQQPGQYSDPYGQPPTQYGDPYAQGYAEQGEQGWNEPEAWGETQGWGEPRARGGNGGGYDERRGILPEWLPTLPTLGIAAFAILLAFLFGRVTAGGGGGSSNTSSTTVGRATTSTLSTTPSTVVVGKGQTLSAVASAAGVAPNALAAYNGITDINHVIVGQVLKIPPPGYTPPPTTGTATTLATTATTKKKGA